MDWQLYRLCISCIAIAGRETRTNLYGKVVDGYKDNSYNITNDNPWDDVWCDDVYCSEYI